MTKLRSFARLTLAAGALALVMSAVTLAPAEAYYGGRGGVSIGIGLGGYGGGYYGPGWGYPPGWGYGYPGYYAPPVAYVAPAPTVVYEQAPVAYAAPAPAPAYAAPAPGYPQQGYAPQGAPEPVAAGASVDPNATTYVNAKGQNCRQYQTSTASSGAPIYQTSCQHSDGSWHTAQ